jgi:hypothetical protein
MRHFCLFAILISMLVLAQSNRAPVVDQLSGLPISQEPHPAIPQSLSRMPQGAAFAQRGAGVFKAAAPRRGALLTSGLGFAPAVDYGSGSVGALSVAVADVNGDGKPDLLVANGAGNVGVLLGNGDGTFQMAVTHPSGGYGAYSVAVADVNGDGKPDLIVANECGDSKCATNGTVGVLLGNGDGTFQPAATFGAGGYSTFSVAALDVNGDGKPDLLVANGCANQNCSGDGVVGVLLGNGDGTFQAAVSYDSGGVYATSIVVADVNGDGKPDLLVGNWCASSGCDTDSFVGVLLGKGDGTFQGAVTYDSGGQRTASIAVADVNEDGKLDFIVGNTCASGSGCPANTEGSVSVLLGNGDGTFQTAMPYDAGGQGAYSVAVADVSGDGNADIVVANCSDGECPGGGGGNGAAVVLLGNGDGTFQAGVPYSSGGDDASSVAIADVNGDGKPDLLVANQCASSSNCNNGTVGVLINIGTTTSLVSSVNPSSFGQSVTFTATVTGHGNRIPTGTVSFYDGTTNVGNSNLNSGGVATLTTSTLAVGTHSMTATYKGDTNFAPSTSPVLYQVVQGAIVSLSPTSLNFGNQTVGVASSPQNVALQNNGNINLTISLIQITGTNSGDFNQTNNCPSSLSPNTNCQISVTFTPTTTGTRNAAVSVTDNAPGSPQSVPLTGVGVLPTATFSPTNLTFPTQLVFTTSKAQPVQLTNNGLGILLISKIAVSGPFSQTNNCPSSLNPAANCTISVRFHPKNKNVFHGAVSVTDNAPGSPQTVPLQGTGTFVQLVPTKLNFGSQPVGTRSLARKITLTNKGHSAVKITGIAITGADAGDFAEINTCGKSVASGASCFIKVTFKPLVKGKRTADVSVYDNGGGSPQQAMLIGTGT